MTARDSLLDQGTLLALCVLFACSTRAPEKTADPPDLAPLVALYETPTARFQPADLDAVALLLEAVATQLAALAIEAELNALLDAIATVELEADVDTTLEAGGFIRITRICPGWQAMPVADRQANGVQIATVRFTETGVEPVVWGDVERCRYRLGDSLIQLDAADDSDFSLAIVRQEPPAGAADDVAVPTLFVLRLTVTIDGQAAGFSADFRIVADGVEYRLEKDDGSLVARIDPAGGLHVRAANGHFACDATDSCRAVEAP